MSFMGDEMQPRSEQEGISLDVVQRTVVSVLIGVVFGLVAGALAYYLAARSDDSDSLARSDVIGLWAMTGVVGLMTSIAILLINRRRAYHPLASLGLLPMAVSAFWVFQ